MLIRTGGLQQQRDTEVMLLWGWRELVRERRWERTRRIWYCLNARRVDGPSMQVLILSAIVCAPSVCALYVCVDASVHDYYATGMLRACVSLCVCVCVCVCLYGDYLCMYLSVCLSACIYICMYIYIYIYTYRYI